MTANTTRTRKSLEERLEDFRARLHTLEKRKAEQDKRDSNRLRLRLGAAAVTAGFTDEWTDAQLDRALAAAVKMREESMRSPQPVQKPIENAKAAVATTASPAAKAAMPPKS
jgi:hypothetical protein